MSWPTRVLLALGTLLLASSAAQAATIPVTTTADVVANDGACSLREAVFAARFDASTPATLNCTPGSGEDVVQLEAATYALAAGGVNEDGNESGDLDTGPASALRVAGRGTAATVIGAAGNRAFDVFAGASLGLSDLTVRDAAAPSGSSGGAVRNKGTLTVLRVAFINNAGGDGRPAESIDGAPGEDGGGGGAIASEGQLQVADSLFSLNRAGNGADGRHFEEPSPTGTRRVRPPAPPGRIRRRHPGLGGHRLDRELDLHRVPRRRRWRPAARRRVHRGRQRWGRRRHRRDRRQRERRERHLPGRSRG